MIEYKLNSIRYEKDALVVDLLIDGKRIEYNVTMDKRTGFGEFMRDIYMKDLQNVSVEGALDMAQSIGEQFEMKIISSDVDPKVVERCKFLLRFPMFLKALELRKTITLEG